MQLKRVIIKNYRCLKDIEVSRWANSVDAEGKFIWSEGEAICTFGKHKGRSLKQIATYDPEYLEWIAGSDFSVEVKELMIKAIKGEFPEPPEAPEQTTRDLQF